jgi:hypothetical protein
VKGEVGQLHQGWAWQLKLCFDVLGHFLFDVVVQLQAVQVAAVLLQPACETRALETHPPAAWR